MRTVLIILGIWFLLNVMFVVAMMPPRKLRRQNTHGAPDAKLAPVTIDKEAQAFDEDEKISLGLAIASVGMAAFFVLAAPIAEAIDAAKRALGRKPPAQ